MKGEPMNKDRIEQCQADIAKLQEELVRLQKASQPRHGDVVMRAADGSLRIVIIPLEGRPKSYDRAGEAKLGVYGDGAIDVAAAYKRGNYKVLGNVFARERIKL
jgi:hypothetical protein